MAYSDFMSTVLARLFSKAREWNGLRVFEVVDFRYLWIGSMLSFVGSQVQNVAQGYYVFELTNSKLLLSLVTFCGMVPITLLGPLVAVVADVWDRRKALVWTSILFAAGAGFLSLMIFVGKAQYWMFIVVSLASGFTQIVEQPVRQSVVRTVVPREHLAAAIPVQGMTFNLARTIGPALGGIIIATIGTPAAFLINAVSYFCVWWAAAKIKSDLSPASHRMQPIKDLIFEGMLYTVRHPSLLVLFIMEGTTSLFGIFYLSQMPAIAKELLGVDAKGLGLAYSAVGIGALCSLFFLSSVSDKPWKPAIIRVAMTSFGVVLFILSTITSPGFAYLALGVLGACTMAQFNTTNTMFQLIAPVRLQGRVLAMHMWAVGGLAPIGALLFGTLADLFGLREAMVIGAAVIFVVSLGGWIFRNRVLEPRVDDEIGAA